MKVLFKSWRTKFLSFRNVRFKVNKLMQSAEGITSSEAGRVETGSQITMTWSWVLGQTDGYSWLHPGLFHGHPHEAWLPDLDHL